MLKDYPVKFNTTEILQAHSWESKLETIETQLQTESAKDVINVQRYGKMTVSASYRVTDKWLKIFRQYSHTNSIEVSMWDGELQEYTVRTMRMRNYSEKLIPKSERVTVSNGLWEVSFSLIEY